MHALTSAAGCSSLRQPDGVQDVCTVTGATRIELAVAELGKDIGFWAADPLDCMLLALPAWFQFVVDLTGSFFERESGGGNARCFSAPITQVDRCSPLSTSLRMERPFSRASAMEISERVPGPARVACLLWGW